MVTQVDVPARQAGQTLTPQQKVATMEAALTVGGAYRTWSRAFNRKDVSVLVQWIDRTCIPECTVKLLDLKVEHPKEIQTWLKAAIPQLKPAEDGTLKIKSFKIDGDSTTVTVLGNCAEILCQPGAVKEMKQFVAKDVWSKTADGWKLKSRQIVQEASVSAGSRSGPINSAAPKT